MWGFASRLDPPGMLRSSTRIGRLVAQGRPPRRVDAASATTAMSGSASSSIRKVGAHDEWSSARTMVISSSSGCPLGQASTCERLRHRSTTAGHYGELRKRRGAPGRDHHGMGYDVVVGYDGSPRGGARAAHARSRGRGLDVIYSRPRGKGVDEQAVLATLHIQAGDVLVRRSSRSRGPPGTGAPGRGQLPRGRRDRGRSSFRMAAHPQGTTASPGT